jgi:hypothetical protein
VANFDSGRLGALFRQRAQIAGELYRARAIAERLTLEHNDLVRDAGQAATAGGRQRAQAKASRKREEAAKARNYADGLSRNLHDKETEIADLIEALWAASQPLLSAGTMRQLNDHLGAIRHHLERIDSEAAPLGPALNALQAVIADQSVLIRSVNNRRGDPGPSGRPPGETDRRSSERGRVPVVQMGWRRGIPAVAEPRSPQLGAEAIAALPERVTVVLFASEPRDQPRPDLDKEIREIQEKIDAATFGDRITLRPWLATQAFDIIPGFNRHKPHMVQFSGHGTADGVLMMGPNDQSEPVAADRLIQMFRWTGENLRVVFFNICDSEEHARAAAQFVDAAIGMHGQMHDTPARAFAASLYSGLAFGSSVKRAFHQACAVIGDEPDSTRPQLFFRHGVDPHKVVLVRPEGGGAP